MLTLSDERRTNFSLPPSGTDWLTIAFDRDHWLAGQCAWLAPESAPRTPIGAGIGLGTARLRPGRDGTHLDAAATLRAGIEAGIRVIDTASNYGDGFAEVAVGVAVRAMVASGVLDRHDVMIVSKAGYLPISDGHHHAHSLDPAFLAEAIEASRRRLGLATIDAYLVHNPEEQWDVGQPGWDALPGAFQVMERAACEGRIGCYGVSAAEGFDPDAACFHALPRLLEIARSVGGPDHHFRMIELPVSLWRREAFAATPYQRGRGVVNTLTLAAAEGLRVLASTPMGGRRDRSEAVGVLRRMFPHCLIESPAMLALQFARSVPGVHAALAGVSTQAHIDELRALMELPRWDLE